MRKDLAKNIIKILNCLKEAEEGWLWYREISRRTELHHKTVSRLIENHLQMFLDIQSMEPFNIKMVRLKPNTDLNGILKYLAIKEKLENAKQE
ncbi:MAG: hypothetical protein QW472_05430 [Candidatus Aenigmatarchaeota archaeon]